MRKYRLLCVNAANGHMEVERHFEAINDDAAVQLAEGCRKHRAAELWRSYRVVLSWKSSGMNRTDQSTDEVA